MACCICPSPISCPFTIWRHPSFQKILQRAILKLSRQGAIITAGVYKTIVASSSDIYAETKGPAGRSVRLGHRKRYQRVKMGQIAGIEHNVDRIVAKGNMPSLSRPRHCEYGPAIRQGTVVPATGRNPAPTRKQAEAQVRINLSGRQHRSYFG